MPWKHIRDLPGCTPVRPPLGLAELFVIRSNMDGTGWMMGRYKDLSIFATRLRHEKVLRDFLLEHQVRIGMRRTDVPPVDVVRRRGYGELVKGQNVDRDFSAARVSSIVGPAHSAELASLNRRSDQEQNVKSFWESQTPQSHHIVEYNNLETMGVSCRDGADGMDYHQLPAVLLAAELHQRYISTILKPAHQWDKARLRSEMVSAYRKLYLDKGKLFEPLWHVAAIILKRANLDV